MADFIFNFILLSLFALFVLGIVWYSYYLETHYEKQEQWKKKSRELARCAYAKAEREYNEWKKSRNHHSR